MYSMIVDRDSKSKTIDKKWRTDAKVSSVMMKSLLQKIIRILKLMNWLTVMNLFSITENDEKKLSFKAKKEAEERKNAK